VTLAVYFSGGEDDPKAVGGAKGGKGRLSFVGEGGDDDAEADEDDMGVVGVPRRLDPLDLPPGCPPVEAREPDADFMADEYMPNEVEAICVGASGLRVMDKARLYGKGSSDPFLKLTVRKGKKGKSARTPTAKKTLAPAWHHRLVLPAPDVAASCSFECWDEDLTT
jgi:hypothetical protein